MAASSSVTADWTTCPICLEVFDNPKALPCIHGFCLKCLQIYFKEKSPGDTVSCPMCRKEFKIPPDGIGGLQHHFFIQYLVDARNASTKPTDEVACEVCSAENETGAAEEMPTATMYCFDCRQRLCERCSRPHRRMTSGTHLVRALGSGLEQEVIQLRGSSCEKHKDKRVELYCYQCDENICLMCSAVKHRNHESGEIPEVADSFRSRIDDDNKQVLPNVSAFRQQLERTEEEVTKLLSQVENVEKMIVDAGEAIKRVVDNQISEYLLELQSVKSDSTKQADFVQEQLQLALVAMESFHTYSRELLDKGRPSDITRAASELHKRATELLGNDVTSVHYCPPHVTFAPADVTKLTPLQLIGNLTINHLGKVPDGAGGAARAGRAASDDEHVEAPPQEQKQMLGERLFPLIHSMYPDMAGKITGMLLELDNSELLHMLEYRESLKAKVEEAVAVLHAYQAKVEKMK